MRMSILNTATTEQMGYGIISFFVCFPLMNQIVIHPSIYRFPPQYSLRQIVFFFRLHEIYKLVFSMLFQSILHILLVFRNVHIHQNVLPVQMEYNVLLHHSRL